MLNYKPIRDPQYQVVGVPIIDDDFADELNARAKRQAGYDHEYLDISQFPEIDEDVQAQKDITHESTYVLPKLPNNESSSGTVKIHLEPYQKTSASGTSDLHSTNSESGVFGSGQSANQEAPSRKVHNSQTARRKPAHNQQSLGYEKDQQAVPGSFVPLPKTDHLSSSNFQGSDYNTSSQALGHVSTDKEASKYYFPPRIMLPLPSCYVNPNGYVCCNKELNTLIEDTYNELKSDPRFHECDLNKLANKIQKKAQERFKTDFESFAAFGDFATKIHFKNDLVCKVEVGGKYTLAYGTVKDVDSKIKRKKKHI